MLETGLDDHVCAVAHRAERIAECARTRLVDLDDALPRLRTSLDVRALVFQAALPKHLKHRVIEERPLCELVRGQSLERRQMAAPDELGQVRREEESLVSPKVHSLSLVPHGYSTRALKTASDA